MYTPIDSANLGQSTFYQLNMPTRSLSKRLSGLCLRLFSSNPRKQNSNHSRPAQPRVKISYPQQVQSSAPISPPPHRNPSYRPTPAEQRPLSDISFSCTGLGRNPREPISGSRAITPDPWRPNHVPSSTVSSEWIAPPGMSLRTDELCRVCDKQPVRDGTDICNKCKLALGPFNFRVRHIMLIARKQAPL